MIEKTAQALADMMRPVLSKVENALENQQIASLQIARNNVLGYLPLQVMPLSDGTPLCLKTPLSFEINAVRQPVRREGLVGSSALVVADPQDNLPFARQEAFKIAEFFPKATVLIGKDATKARVLQELQSGKYSFIHFASHGKFHWEGSDVDGIKLHGGEVLSADDIQAVAIPPKNSVVMLAACETGLADSWNNQIDPMSLARALLERGASSVLASLWPLLDAATSEMSVLVVRDISGGAGGAEALWKAQVAVAKNQTFSERGALRWTEIEALEGNSSNDSLFSWAGLFVVEAL